MKQETVNEFVCIADHVFDIAVGIVLQAKAKQLTGEQFETRQRDLANTLKQWRALDVSGVWSAWPHKPTSFGQFQEAGSCAVEVAIQFAETVHAAIQYAKVASLSRFRVEPGDIKAFAKWAKAVTVELRTTTLDLDNWTLPALLRDSQLLRHAIRAELAEVIKTQTGDPRGKRDNKRENGKKVGRYEHCYRHPDLKIQAAAGHLNRIGITRGKAKALKVYFDTEWEGQEGPMSLEDAETMLDTMKHWEAKGRKQAGQ